MAAEIWKISQNGPFSGDRVLTNQIRRAALSVVSNIAEGFERGSRAEFGHFLKIAKGFCGEVRAQMLVASDLNYISTKECQDFCFTMRQISAGLSNLARHLRESKKTEKVTESISRASILLFHLSTVLLFYSFPLPFSLKNDRPVVVQQYPVLDVPSHRSGKHHLLQVSPLFHQIVQRITV